jgi:hypothetical protein
MDASGIKIYPQSECYCILSSSTKLPDIAAAFHDQQTNKLSIRIYKKFSKITFFTKQSQFTIFNKTAYVSMVYFWLLYNNTSKYSFHIPIYFI